MSKVPFSAAISLALALAGSASAQPLAVTTTELPAASLGVPYSVEIAAAGGSPPYEWCGPPPASCPWSPGVSSTLLGELPADVSVSDNGVISGIPAVGGPSSFQVEVRDSAGATSISNFFTVNVIQISPFLVATGSLPLALVGKAYSTQLSAAGGQVPSSWQILDTTLEASATDVGADLGAVAPPGLSLDHNGNLSGTPSQAGSYKLSVEVTDSSSPPQVASGTVTLVVIPEGGLSILNSLPQGTVGEAYDFVLTIHSADPQSVVYAVANSGGGSSTSARASLPPGITVNSHGVLAGVPTTVGSFQFTVQATDGESRVVPLAFQLVVVAGPNAGCSSVGGGTSASYGVVLLALAAMSRSRKRR
jgi:large repetitive protein